MISLENNVLVFFRVSVLVLGIILTVTSFKAYNRTKTKYLRYSTIGFGIITIRIFIEGLFFEIENFDLVFVHIIESFSISIGVS